MASPSRRPKKIGNGSHKAPTSEDDRSARREHAAGAKPTSLDAQERQKSNLPAWMIERHAEASKGIPRQDAERTEGSDEFVTVVEAAALLRVSPRTVRRHLTEGRLPYIRAGR
jgi:Fic family protein